jgi:hypothetical protein
MMEPPNNERLSTSNGGLRVLGIKTPKNMGLHSEFPSLQRHIPCTLRSRGRVEAKHMPNRVIDAQCQSASRFLTSPYM